MSDGVVQGVSSPPRRWWLPSVGAALWLIFALGLMLSQWRVAMINEDGDACLHWRIGNWMIEHRAVIRTDAFSHTRPGAPLISKEWLSEVLFAAAGDALGWNGIALLATVLIATCLWLLHRQLLSEGIGVLPATAATLLAATTGTVHWLARPHLFTLIFAVIFTGYLRRFDRGKLETLPLLYRLVPLMALWVNLHGAFFTGFVIILTFLVGDAIAWMTATADARPGFRSKFLGFGWLLAGCALASLLNPNGWRLPAHVIEFLKNPILAHQTNEFRPPNLHSGTAYGLLIEFGVIGLTLLFLRPTMSATDVIVMGTWGLLALLSARNIPIFGLVVSPILAKEWQDGLANAKPGRWLDFYHRLSEDVTTLNRNADGRATVAVAFLVLVAILVKPNLVGGQPVITTDVLSNRFPVAAVQFVKAHPEAVHGQMFNDYGWGGYLMLTMPAHRVFVDGRNDFYGPDLVREFSSVNSVGTNWETVLRKYNVGWTILPPDHPLTRLLAKRADWKLVYSDPVASIYGRTP
ncbi:MAG TPA: hypothetical protein VMP11_16730 [Verrucomicrobiae bacterium]|nr:hypothetical protein [Verrucomicrobiae bacterium]